MILTSACAPPLSPYSAGDRSGRAILDLALALLVQDFSSIWPLDFVVAEVAAATGARGAGLAELSTGQHIARFPSSSEPLVGVPGNESSEFLARVRDAWTAMPIIAANRSWLLAPGTSPNGTGGWLLWVEAEPDRVWSSAEQAGLMLTAQVLARAPGSDEAPRWGRQLDRLRRQQRLEDANRVVQRLTHDFGNILTTIFGFSELSARPTGPRPAPGRLPGRDSSRCRARISADRSAPTVRLSQSVGTSIRPSPSRGCRGSLSSAGGIRSPGSV